MRFTRVAGLCLLFALLLSTPANAQQNYRSVAGNVNWGSASSWEVQIGNDWFPSTSYPGQNPGTGTVTILAGATVTIDVSVPPQNTIGGLVVSGTLQFDNTSGRVLTVGAGGVTIAPGGQFNASGTTQDGENDTHTLTIQNGGSLTNNGTINFRRPDGANFDVVNLNLSGDLAGTGTSSTFNNITFNGTNNQTITIGGTIDNVQAVTYNNTGTAPNNRIINQSTVFTDALTRRQRAAGATNISTFTAGNYVHDVDETYLVSNASITIPAAMTVTAQKGIMDFATGGTAQLTLNGGDLIVTGTGTGTAGQVNCGGTVIVTGTAVNGGTLTISDGAIMRVRQSATTAGTAVSFIGTSTINVQSGAQFLIGDPVNSTGDLVAGENNSFTRYMLVDNATVRVYGRWLVSAGVNNTNTTFDIDNESQFIVSENVINVGAAQTCNLGRATIK